MMPSVWAHIRAEAKATGSNTECSVASHFLSSHSLWGPWRCDCGHNKELDKELRSLSSLFFHQRDIKELAKMELECLEGFSCKWSLENMRKISTEKEMGKKDISPGWGRRKAKMASERWDCQKTTVEKLGMPSSDLI